MDVLFIFGLKYIKCLAFTSIENWMEWSFLLNWADIAGIACSITFVCIADIGCKIFIVLH